MPASKVENVIEVRVPDIGDFKDVPIIDVLVKVGDSVRIDDPLVTIESDKASMDVPSPGVGVVRDLRVKVGDRVSEGSLILTLEPAATNGATSTANGKSNGHAAAPVAVSPVPQVARLVEQTVPDIGDFKDVPVIEVLVKVGDSVGLDDPLVTLESEKASMDVPTANAGVVRELKVKLGDRVSQGTVIALLESVGVAAAAASVAASAPAAAVPAHAAAAAPAPQAHAPQAIAVAPQPTVASAPATDSSGKLLHASPAIRRLAREFGLDLARVTGSGPRGRITREDVQAFVKRALQAPAASANGASVGGLQVLPWPKVDFAKYGPVDVQPLSRIKKISGPNLHRNWVMIPHVTNNDEADITELEAFRQRVNEEQGKSGVKLTMLAFLIKAVVAALKRFPEFNASLDGDNLVLKKYYHIGFAADTPNGLVVPVLRDADQKGVLAIAQETRDLAAKARDGKLMAAEMQGGTFTISSLGGIGGTTFTPIINAPEVAILGATRSAMKPVWDAGRGEFVPRLMVPLSLSYDHRVIDGAAAARFVVHLVKVLSDLRRALL